MENCERRSFALGTAFDRLVKDIELYLVFARGTLRKAGAAGVVHSFQWLMATCKLR